MKNKNENDDKILELIRKNQEEGMKLVIQSYGGLVYTICRNILTESRYRDIEEAVIDTYTQFWMQIKKERLITKSIRNYIAGIAHNCAVNKLKNILKGDKILCYTDFEMELEIDVTTEVERKLNAEIINDVILNMPDIEREIFIRRYFLYERVKEIAHKMQLPEKKVENILFRYKNKLKEILIGRGIGL